MTNPSLATSRTNSLPLSCSLSLKPSLILTVKELLADPPSLTDTEPISDSDIDYIRNPSPGTNRKQLETQGIKVRDFVYEP
jgi:hypothetical protein